MKLGRIPLYGVLLAPTLVLATYGGTHVSPDHLWRPLLVGTAVGLVLFALFGLSRRWHFAALVTALVVLGIVGIFPLFVLLALVTLVVQWRGLRSGITDSTPTLTRPLNAVVGLWFSIALVGAIVASIPPSLPTSPMVSITPGRNIYLILLDAYPRHDSLMEYFGFDNQPFLSELAERGFTVADESRTEYPSTVQTVPTMFHQRPLEDLLGGPWDASNEQHRLMWHQLNQAPTPAAFAAAGYETYSIISAAAGLDWRSADVVRDSPWLSAFERHLLRDGILTNILPFDQMHRAMILDTFTYLEESAGRSPRFVFAHILSPHNPYVFAADGSPAEPCDLPCVNHAGPPNPMLADRLIGQVTFINGRTLEAIDHVIEVDPTATIIVFSDHGLRRDRADMDEWFRTLFAARNADFPDDVSVLELFSLLDQVISVTSP